MLEFKELKPEEYGSFYAKSPQRTFLNSLEAMEHLKVRNREIIYFGVKKDGELCAACALSSFAIAKKLFRCFYAQRGFLMDYSDKEELSSVEMSDYYTEDYLERLSISEHDRWMAFLETEGWIPATKEDVYAYRESGISKGRHNCPILKMHPYICEYENLKDLSMDLEGKDTTVYDEELILRIPDILGDKWNVAGKKFTIITLE